MLTDRGDGSEPEYWGEIEGDEEGDKQGWLAFLSRAGQVLDELGDVPFLHYSHYERTWVKKYTDRWGDPGRTGTRVLGLLWDMHSNAIRNTVCLPVPSYGLKHVEELAGFKRSQEDYGGLWSVVQYHKWLRAGSKEERRTIAEGLLRYNREDCKGMRHVLAWLRECVWRLE